MASSDLRLRRALLAVAALLWAACRPDTDTARLERTACLFPLERGVCAPAELDRPIGNDGDGSLRTILQTCYLLQPDLLQPEREENLPYGTRWQRAPTGTPSPCEPGQIHLSLNASVAEGERTLVCSGPGLPACPSLGQGRRLVCERRGAPIELGTGRSSASLASDGERLLALWRDEGGTLSWQLLDESLARLQGSTVSREDGVLACGGELQIRGWSRPWLSGGQGRFFTSEACVLAGALARTDNALVWLEGAEGRRLRCPPTSVAAVPRRERPALLVAAGSAARSQTLDGIFTDEIIEDGGRDCGENAAHAAVQPPEIERVPWVGALSLSGGPPADEGPGEASGLTVGLLTLTVTEGRGVALGLSFVTEAMGTAPALANVPLLLLPASIAASLDRYLPGSAAGRRRGVVVIASPELGIIGSEVGLGGNARSFTLLAPGTPQVAPASALAPLNERPISVALQETDSERTEVGVCYVGGSDARRMLLVGDGSPTSRVTLVGRQPYACAAVPSGPLDPPDERFQAVVFDDHEVWLVGDSERVDLGQRLRLPAVDGPGADLHAARLRGRLLLLGRLESQEMVAHEIETGALEPVCDADGSCPVTLTCRGGLCVEALCQDGQSCGPDQACVAGGCITRTATARELWRRSVPELITRPVVTVREAADPANDVAVVHLVTREAGQAVLIERSLLDGSDRVLPLPGQAETAAAAPLGTGGARAVAYAAPYLEDPHRSAWYFVDQGGQQSPSLRLVPREPLEASFPRLALDPAERPVLAYVVDQHSEGNQAVVLSFQAATPVDRSRAIRLVDVEKVTGLALAVSGSPGGATDPLPLEAAVAFTGELTRPLLALGATAFFATASTTGAAQGVPSPVVIGAEGLSEDWLAPEVVPLGPGVTALSVAHVQDPGRRRILVPVDALGQKLGPPIDLGPQRTVLESFEGVDGSPPASVLRHGDAIYASRVEADGRVRLEEVVCRDR